MTEVTYKREIFGIGGPSGYAICDITLHETAKDGYMLVRDPKTGHEYVAKPGMGTWCAIKPYDMLYKLMWLEKEVQRLRNKIAQLASEAGV